MLKSIIINIDLNVYISESEQHIYFKLNVNLHTTKHWILLWIYTGGFYTSIAKLCWVLVGYADLGCTIVQWAGYLDGNVYLPQVRNSGLSLGEYQVSRCIIYISGLFHVLIILQGHIRYLKHSCLKIWKAFSKNEPILK